MGLPMTDTIAWLVADPALLGVRVIGGEVSANIIMVERTVSLVLSGGASIGPGARSDAGIGTVRMDVTCYASTGAEAESLYAVVRDRMLEVTGGSETLLTAIISGGPVYGVDGDTRWPSIWGSWTIDHLR